VAVVDCVADIVAVMVGDMVALIVAVGEALTTAPGGGVSRLMPRA
jgi:hypothetical protein